MKRFWTEEEDKYLIENYPHKPTFEIVKFLNRSFSSVYGRAYTLEVKKTDEYLATDFSGRLNKLKNKGSEFQFKKGHVTWNKGKKGLCLGGEKTYFKKGHEPTNTKYDGAISIRDDDGRKYKYIRISKAKWKPLHVVVWEQNNGEVPKGMIVFFKDKNTLNCDLENLELITRIENMKRNTIQRFPKELKSTIRIIAKLKKKINSHEK